MVRMSEVVVEVFEMLVEILLLLIPASRMQPSKLEPPGFQPSPPALYNETEQKETQLISFELVFLLSFPFWSVLIQNEKYCPPELSSSKEPPPSLTNNNTHRKPYIYKIIFFYKTIFSKKEDIVYPTLLSKFHIINLINKLFL